MTSDLICTIYHLEDKRMMTSVLFLYFIGPQQCHDDLQPTILFTMSNSVKFSFSQNYNHMVYIVYSIKKLLFRPWPINKIQNSYSKFGQNGLIRTKKQLFKHPFFAVEIQTKYACPLQASSTAAYPILDPFQIKYAHVRFS